MAQAGWYAIQSYSGHENKVQRLIQQKIDAERAELLRRAQEGGAELSDSAVDSEEILEGQQIHEVLVPTQEVTEIRNGKRVQVVRRLYPGYVLVKMVFNEGTQHTINSVQGVIKFVGSGAAPRPLRPEEMNKILGVESDEDTSKVQDIPFHPGQVVEITQGPFTDFSGTVQEVFADKGKVKVEVSLFGRPTSVELDFTQLKGY
jgi:transcription termination/antitermination protein NusG